MTDTGWFPGRLPGDPIGRVPPQGVGGHGAADAWPRHGKGRRASPPASCLAMPCDPDRCRWRWTREAGRVALLAYTLRVSVWWE
jgi:hypothetical protein